MDDVSVPMYGSSDLERLHQDRRYPMVFTLSVWDSYRGE